MAHSRVERNISYDDTRRRYYVNLEFGTDPKTGKQVKKAKTYEKITQVRAAPRSANMRRQEIWGRWFAPRKLPYSNGCLSGGTM